MERNAEGAVLSADRSLAERAHHPDEIASTPGLAVDAEYYLGEQVFPVVSRMCAPIEGTNPARLAECLGLDATRYKQSMTAVSLADVSYEDPEDRDAHLAVT